MKKLSYYSMMSVLFAMLLAVGLLVGCENGGDAYGLTVSPSEVTLSTVSNIVTFTVVSSTNEASGLRSLSFPLEWSVVNPSLGSILAAEGDSAIYSRTEQSGVNIITVRDQYNSEGFATVRQ